MKKNILIPDKSEEKKAKAKLTDFLKHLKEKGFDRNIRQYLTSHYVKDNKLFDNIYQKILFQFNDTEKLWLKYQTSGKIVEYLETENKYFTISSFKILDLKEYCFRTKVFIYNVKIGKQDTELRVMLEVERESALRGKKYKAGVVPIHLLGLKDDRKVLQSEEIEEPGKGNNKED